jgi:hypothetical protein
MMGFKPAASLTEQIANHLSDEIINGGSPRSNGFRN